ncbi:hypothetical protein BZG36_02447 [Bifiguratus adelaidae]|uniref:Ferritin n=1 Tax=Bifiguratus adelaidae TaxID=1938954 RepID=A0A261Y3K0_9FUNG|nr:hypothetical protein BZG36_02447 [Bifiguratus adelaidae]
MAMKISDSMLAGLIRQANRELENSNYYLSASLWFADQELNGSAAWCRQHSEEERTHGLKIFDHIAKRRAKGSMVHLEEQVRPQFNSPLDVWRLALEQEQINSKCIHDLVAQARKENDFTTDNFLQWYVNEQLEEESAVDDILTNAEEVLKTKGLYRDYDKMNLLSSIRTQYDLRKVERYTRRRNELAPQFEPKDKAYYERNYVNGVYLKDGEDMSGAENRRWQAWNHTVEGNIAYPAQTFNMLDLDDKEESGDPFQDPDDSEEATDDNDGGLSHTNEADRQDYFSRRADPFIDSGSPGGAKAHTSIPSIRRSQTSPGQLTNTTRTEPTSSKPGLTKRLSSTVSLPRLGRRRKTVGDSRNLQGVKCSESYTHGIMEWEGGWVD